MNIDLYSDRAKQAIQSAQSLALARRHQQLAPVHLLKVLLEEQDGLSRALIQSAGGRPDAVDQIAGGILAKTPKVEGGSGQLYMNPDTARVFATAEADAKAAGDAFVTTERLLIATAKEGGEAAKALKDAGVTSAAAASFCGSAPPAFISLATSPPSLASAISSRSVVTKASPAFLASSSAVTKVRAVSAFM